MQGLARAPFRPAALNNYENGKLPKSELKQVAGFPGIFAYAETADAMSAMIAAARKDGIEIRITDGYRSYEQQVDVKRRKGELAATPGKSNHGWGQAFDIAVGGYDSKTYQWLAKNAHLFGFVNPPWAVKGGSKPEPWHWEYWKK